MNELRPKATMDDGGPSGSANPAQAPRTQQ